MTTELSLRAESLALTFMGAVRRVFSSGTLEVTTPEGGTNGGERALQHICLVTSDGRTFVLGTFNVAERRAELRTLGYSLALSKERFGRELRLPPKEYMRFLEIASKVFGEFGVKVDVLAFGSREMPAQKPAPKPRMTLPYAAAITAGSFAAFAAAGWMVMR